MTRQRHVEAELDGEYEEDHEGARVRIGMTEDRVPIMLYLGRYFLGDRRERPPQFWAGLEATPGQQSKLISSVSRLYRQADYATADIGDYADQDYLWLPLRLKKRWHQPHMDISDAKHYTWLGRFFDAGFGEQRPTEEQKLIEQMSAFVAQFEPRQRKRGSRRTAPKKVTQVERIQKVRLQQAIFRNALLDRYNSRCGLSKVRTREILRASHIKPFALSNYREQQDPNNGILLRADFDALFDEGLISFGRDGRILVSSMLSDKERRDLTLSSRMCLEPSPSAGQRRYLEWHNEFWFKP